MSGKNPPSPKEVVQAVKDLNGRSRPPTAGDVSDRIRGQAFVNGNAVPDERVVEGRLARLVGRGVVNQVGPFFQTKDS